MSDMLKRQMQALESMMYSDDDTTVSTTEGLMGQGVSDSDPEDYVTSFVKYLRSKRDLDPAKAREEIPAVKARNVSITDEDIAKYESEMSVFEQAKQSAMDARLQREASGITQSLTEEDVSVRAAVGDPEYGNKLDKDQSIMIDVTDTDEGKLSNEEPLYELGEDIRTTDMDISKLDPVVRRDTPAGKGLMSPSTEEAPEIEKTTPENKSEKDKRRDKLIESVFKAEGGYSTDKNDTGNYWKGEFIGTNHGISAPILAAKLGRAPTVAEMKALTKEEAKEIAAQHYYDRFDIDKLPDDLEEIVFHAVYMGESRGVRALQNLLGLTPDGVMGPKTKAAIRNASFTKQEFADEYLRELEKGTTGYSKPAKTWSKHGKGWKNRYNKLAA
jgi:hypothetical protein